MTVAIVDRVLVAPSQPCQTCGGGRWTVRFRFKVDVVDGEVRAAPSGVPTSVRCVSCFRSETLTVVE